MKTRTEAEPTPPAGTTRERLLDAARQCLLERGHQACSVKVIAERAGVNHGLVHHYFGSKENLWLEVVRREAERIRGSIPAERGRFLEGFYRPEFLRHPDRMRLAVEFLGLAKALPGVAAVLREHFRLNRQEVQRRFGITDDALATLVFGAMFGMAIQGALDPELEVERAAELLLGLLHERGPGEHGNPEHSTAEHGAAEHNAVESSDVEQPGARSGSAGRQRD